LGATPVTVAKTRRLHFAKKLINETSLPMGQIALAAGFGSVRRFNAAFRQTYKRTPSELRWLAHVAGPQPENEYLFRLHFRPPFQWETTVGLSFAPAIPGVESVATGSYHRTISLNGDSGTLGISLSSRSAALDVCISFPEPRWLFLIVERVRRIFDLSADPSEITAQLGNDSLLSQRVAAMPGLRVPGCWDGFELAVRAILGQQVSVAAASTLAGRLVLTFGRKISGAGTLTHLFPQAEILAQTNLARIGLPQARAERSDLWRALSLPGESFRFGRGPRRVSNTSLRDTGDWELDRAIYRDASVGRPRRFPAGDLGCCVRLHSAVNANWPSAVSVAPVEGLRRNVPVARTQETRSKEHAERSRQNPLSDVLEAWPWLGNAGRISILKL